MPYLYLVLSVVCMSSGNICGGFYNRKNKDRIAPTALYNFITISTVLLCWLVLYAIDFSFDVKVLYFAIPMGLCYSLTVFSNINALKYGPVSLSALFLQLSLIGVTIWGFLFWDEEVTPLAIAGLALAVLSVVLCLYTKKDEEQKEKENKISAKWLVFAILSFIGNAATSILQRTQQTEFKGEHANMLMTFAMTIGFIGFFILYARSDKRDSAVMLKKTGWLPMAYGVMNVGLNVFIMLLATSPISPSLVYPVVAVGGLSINSLASLFVFKEKLVWWQWIGIAVGALAVVFLSL